MAASLSIYDQRYAALVALGVGDRSDSISDMERIRLLTATGQSLTAPVNLSMADLYRLAGEVPFPNPGYTVL